MRGTYICGGLIVTAVSLLGTTLIAANAQDRQGPRPNIVVHEDGSVSYDGKVFESGRAFAESDLFRQNGLRCRTDEVNAAWLAPDLDGGENRLAGGSSADCSSSFTNPDAQYDPSVVKYRVPVVVHVIRSNDGVTGHLTMEDVESQIEILNEDFLALPGTNGENGADVQIEFFLATEDPDGAPTTGVTYTNNSTWFNDSGTYYNTLAWDTTRYLNIYTNNAGGSLGYAYLPWSGTRNTDAHRVVVYHAAFGRDSSYGPPFDQGRTATHEVGHYFSLYHTFDSGTCSTSCYTTGDRICDTNTETSSNFGCADEGECGTVDPYHNYMNYSDDLCMEEFTPEQARRMRCGLEHYYPNLYEIVDDCPTDITGNDATDVEDLLTVLGNWGPCPDCDADVDGNDAVDVEDLLAVLGAWGPCP